MRRATLPLLAAAIVGLAPAGAAARTPRLLWATVNVCDSARSPNQMGVRGRMPGNGRRQRMYMRFRAQWWSSTSGRWLGVRGRGGRSQWVYAGSARYEFQQAGWIFSFGAPAAGRRFLLRGLVDFQWRARRRTPHHRARWVVVKRATRVTRGGITRAQGSDPPVTSAASCTIV